MFVSNFPFAVVYRPDQDGIVIFAIAHHSRRPEYWQPRIQEEQAEPWLMSKRVDSASRFIPASPSAVYTAFAEPRAMERWLPPKGMAATMLHFDFREGGSYRMRLTYKDPEQGRGKTSGDADEVEVRFVKLIEANRIEQAVTFESNDPAFSGVMRMIWALDGVENGTIVTIRCENVPEGVRPEDHEAGMNSTLDNLASFLEGERK